jgi:hypothetical protein
MLEMIKIASNQFCNRFGWRDHNSFDFKLVLSHPHPSFSQLIVILLFLGCKFIFNSIQIELFLLLLFELNRAKAKRLFNQKTVAFGLGQWTPLCHPTKITRKGLTFSLDPLFCRDVDATWVEQSAPKRVQVKVHFELLIQSESTLELLQKRLSTDRVEVTSGRGICKSVTK